MAKRKQIEAKIHPQLASLAMSVEQLVPDPTNARRHDDRNLQAIAQSLDEHGQRKPIVAQRVGDRLIVRAGNGTLAAAQQLGWSSLAVVVVEEGDVEATRYALRDNRTAELAEWDDDALRQALRECAESEADIAALGWDPDEFQVEKESEREAKDPESREAGIKLSEEFLVPPFSVLDARRGYWNDRKEIWNALGLRSSLGRSDGLSFASVTARLSDYYYQKRSAEVRAGRELSKEEFESDYLTQTGVNSLSSTGTSTFDPVLAEVLVTWFSPAGGRVLDPFAGGSVRGVVSGWLGRSYVGVDLREEQVEENRSQAARIFSSSDRARSAGVSGAEASPPRWIVGDAQDVGSLAADGAPYDFVLTCPPYADLEVYSDDPRDLSTMEYPEFLSAYSKAIDGSASLLAPDRFFAIVVGEVREKKGGGAYRGLVPDTIRACEAAGLRYYNEIVLLTMLGSTPIRFRGAFNAGRKIGKIHQNVLVFVKGDPGKATEACGPVRIAEFEGDDDLAP